MARVQKRDLLITPVAEGALILVLAVIGEPIWRTRLKTGGGQRGPG